MISKKFLLSEVQRLSRLVEENRASIDATAAQADEIIGRLIKEDKANRKYIQSISSRLSALRVDLRKKGL